PWIRSFDNRDLDAPYLRKTLAPHRLRDRLDRGIGACGCRWKPRIPITRVRLEDDAMARLPFLEAIRARADRILHRAAAFVGVFLDHLAGHGTQRRAVEEFEERV